MVESSINALPARRIKLSINIDNELFKITASPDYSPAGLARKSIPEINRYADEHVAYWIAELPTNHPVRKAIEEDGKAEIARSVYMEEVRRRLGEDGFKEGAGLDAEIKRISDTLPQLKDRLQYIKNRFRSTIRRHQSQLIEMIGLHGGLVGKRAGRKISDLGHSLQVERKKKNRKWAESQIVKTESTEIPLSTVMDHKKEGRFAELTALSNGLEKFARSRGLIPCFMTLTAPGRFHPNPSMGQKSWTGATPRKSADWLQQEWEKLRTRLDNIDIVLSGIRVAEAHYDQCIHFHGLFYVHPSERCEIEKNIRMVPEWKDEVGAQIRWLDDIDDGKKASASTYILKYVLKALTDADDESLDCRNSEALSIWGIRSIATPGLPQMQIWRTLRDKRTIDIKEDHLIAALRYAVVNGDYRTFLEKMGGMGIKTKNRPFRYEPMSQEIAKETGKKGGFILRNIDKSIISALVRRCAEIRQVTDIPNFPRNPNPNPKTKIGDDFDASFPDYLHIPAPPPRPPRLKRPQDWRINICKVEVGRFGIDFHAST